jgi:protein gp37
VSENTSIEWCNHTFNPWEGCAKVSPGCVNCYAETRNARWGGGTAPNWGKSKPRRRTSEANWKQPLKWNRDDERKRVSALHSWPAGKPMPWTRPRVFCASLADWLDDEVPIEWLADLLDLIRRTPNLDWLLLSKRPQNWRSRLIYAHVRMLRDVGEQGDQYNDEVYAWTKSWICGNAPHNVWIGTTAEDQTRADQRIPQLLEIPAKIRFLSCEPLLESVNLRQEGIYVGDTILPAAFTNYPRIHWVITGGESGTGCRPFDPDWARSLRDQCAAAHVPFFMKQMGGTRKPFAPIPEDLMIRQFPITTTI